MLSVDTPLFFQNAYRSSDAGCVMTTKRHGKENIMLRNASEILGYQLLATDGDIGRCYDFLFDDQQWTIRYMVADTAKWLPGRKVLISPLSLGPPLWADKKLPVALKKEEIESSPHLDKDAPVSRRYEIQWADYYRYPHYWGLETIWGIRHYDVPRKQAADQDETTEQDNQLRSVKEVRDYNINAIDGAIGHVEDFIVDDTNWTLRYLAIDTRNWLPGRKVLIAPAWVAAIRWADRDVDVRMNKSAIENSPAYDPHQPVNLAYEARLYDYYGRPMA
jgi:hypothetical protein